MIFASSRLVSLDGPSRSRGDAVLVHHLQAGLRRPVGKGEPSRRVDPDLSQRLDILPGYDVVMDIDAVRCARHSSFSGTSVLVRHWLLAGSPSTGAPDRRNSRDFDRAAQSVFRLGPIICSGRTAASNSSPVKRPSSIVASRNVWPVWSAYAAIFAALS